MRVKGFAALDLLPARAEQRSSLLTNYPNFYRLPFVMVTNFYQSLGAAFTLALSFPIASWAQEDAPLAEEEVNPVDALSWQTEGIGQVGDQAQIEIPAGYQFIEGSDTRTLMALFGNPPTNRELGLIAPDSLDWFIVFEYEAVGYVKDDEKDDIDADAIMKGMKESDGPSNEARAAAGMEALNTVGWAVEPNYNDDVNSLEWGLILEAASGGQSVNFLTKKLGRYGVMDVVVVCDPEDLDAVLPIAREVLTGFTYLPGKTYAEYQKGDKVAEYGLTALIAGGAVFGAAKLGLFAKLGKLWKVIALGAVAAFVAVKKFFGRLVGMNQQS